jgi:hypothetical protein
MMRAPAIAIVSLLAGACAAGPPPAVPVTPPSDAALAATPPAAIAQDPAATAPPPELPRDEETERWDFAASAYHYALPGESDYFVVTGTADRGALHVEARYQYEDRDTASMWVGWNFGLGDELRLDATLMGGVVAGQTQGVAPGYRFELGYGVLDLSGEGEYLVSIEDHAENFFYSWTELGVTPVGWLRFGAVGQRTKVFDGEPWIDRGLFAGVTIHDFALTVYAFNLDDDERFWVLSVGGSF